MLLHDGVRLFENIDKEKFDIDIMETIKSPIFTHVSYGVLNKTKS